MAISINIQKLSANIFNGCTSIKMFAVPESVTSAGNIDAGAFSGSGIKYVSFLGIGTLGAIQERMTTTNFFGLRADCFFQLKNDAKLYKFINQSRTIQVVQDDFHMIGQTVLTSEQTDYPQPGKRARFSVNRIYDYNEEVAKKFINAPNVFTHGTSNPLVKIPLVVIYIDSRKSQVSRDFIDSVLTKEQFQTAVTDNTSQTPNAIYLLLDRDKASTEQKNNFYKMISNNTNPAEGRKIIKSFPCILVFVNGTLKKNVTFNGIGT